MMSRRASPSARTTRTAPTAPCVPVDRDGAAVPRSVPPDAGPVTGNGSCTSVEGGSERSTGSPNGPLAPGAGPRGRRRGVRPRAPRAAARRRVLGHRGVPDGGARPRHRPPDRLPDLRPAGLARRRSLFQPFGDEAFRMNLLSAVASASPPRVTVDLVRAPDRARSPSASPPASPSPSRRSPGRSARTPTRTSSTWRWSRSCSACSSAGTTGSAATTGVADRRPARGPLAGRLGGRLRARDGQPLADAPPGRPGRPLRAGGRAGHPAAAAPDPRLRGRAGRDRRARLSRAAAPGRPLPGAARLRPPGDVGRASGTWCSRSSSGAACRTPSAISAARWRRSST